ncbi:MAG: insulinase family protein [Ignavibacteria bacterium]|nr:insulinase family protein [Ignavibacteria bacterium]
MKPLLQLIFPLLMIAPLLVQAQSAKEFKIPYEKYTLSNGMDVILHVDKSNPIAAVYIVYHVGSAREVKGKTGFAHLFEHLRFNESQNIPQGMWFKKLQVAGASMINGSTNNDRTNYFEVVPKNALEMALWMESDRMGFLLSKFTPKTFITQQNVVQNEKRQYDNMPYSQADYIIDKLMYPETHPYNWQVIGSLEDLSNASIQDAIDFHNKYYGPSNATLVVAGDIDIAQTKTWVEKYFAEIPSSPKPASLKPMPVKLTESKRASYEDNLANAPQLSVVYAGINDNDPDKDAYALPYLARILGGSKKSPLYKVIVEEKKLASTVQVYAQSQELSGQFRIEVTAFPTAKLSDVEAAIDEGLARFEKEGFTDKDVERQKARKEYALYSQSNTNLGKARLLSDFNIFNGTPDAITENFTNSINVKKADVIRVYERYIKGAHRVVVSMVPKGKSDLAAANSPAFVVPEEAIDKQGTKAKDTSDTKLPPIPSKIDRSKEPVKGADPGVVFPTIWQDKTTANKSIYGITQSTLPLVQFAITFKGGMLLDPAGKKGLSNLTARLLTEGTKTKTSIELKEAIEDLGASINVMSSENSIVLVGSCLSDKFQETFALANEILTQPRWDAKEFEIVKKQIIDGLKQSESSPGFIASDAFDKLVYGKECLLANPVSGTIQSVNGITLDDLKNYYTENISTDVMQFIVVGDIQQKTAQTTFSTLRELSSKNVAIPEVKYGTPAKPGLYFIDIPKARQSVVSVGHASVPVNSPDYFNLVIMNHKLGGDFSSILNMILREAKSFTYGARSGFQGNAYAGLFKANTSVQSNATSETVKIIVEELTKYRNGISQKDLDEVRSSLLKSNAGRFESLQQLLATMQPIVFNGLPLDYVQAREKNIREMTTDKLKELAKKYIQTEKLIILVVGDKATQFDKLKELGIGEPVLLDKTATPIEPKVNNK